MFNIKQRKTIWTTKFLHFLYFQLPPNLFCYLVKWITSIVMQCITAEENEQTIVLNYTQWRKDISFYFILFLFYDTLLWQNMLIKQLLMPHCKTLILLVFHKELVLKSQLKFSYLNVVLLKKKKIKVPLLPVLWDNYTICCA